jgi:transcription antitermination protein NusB
MRVHRTLPAGSARRRQGDNEPCGVRPAGGFRTIEAMPYKRRLVREKTLQALYAYELSHDPVEHIFSNTIDRLRDDPDSYTFARTLFLRCIEAQPEIDHLIKQHVANWEFDRVALLDKLLLRMTVTELLFFEDIPPKVSINEAIEIAKRYSTEQSGRFVNGILDALYESLRKENKLKKTGRGLIDITVNPPRPDEPKNKTT